MNLIEAKTEATSITQFEYNGEVLLTTEQLANFYGTSKGSIDTNFSRNKARFKECRHYFKINGQELKDLRLTDSKLQISEKTRSIMLWTERGALNHAKISDSDQAWDVFDTLVDCYFWRKRGNKNKSVDQRLIGIQQRNFETDTIKGYVQYCVDQKMDAKKANRYYSTLTTETYKALKIKGMTRNDMTAGQLIHLATAERLIGESLENSVLNKIPCRECYYIAKDQVKAYAEIAVNSLVIK